MKWLTVLFAVMVMACPSMTVAKDACTFGGSFCDGTISIDSIDLPVDVGSPIRGALTATSTGLLFGGVVTINSGDNTKFDVAKWGHVDAICNQCWEKRCSCNTGGGG